MIALADCNNFYTSCERVFNPKLKNKPVIVLSNNDGCIISRSKEAKAMGLKMGEPVFKKKEFIKKKNIFVYSTNLPLYGDMSNRVMYILQKEFPKIEIYSIDEAFINLKGIEKKEKVAKKIRQKILQYTGIPISIGIGKTKTLAKIASTKAKKNKEGIYYIKSDKQVEKLLKKTDISKIWGIGKRTAQKLYKHNICSANQLRKQNSNWIKKQLSIALLKTKEELNGYPRFSIEENSKRKKNICTTRTFTKEIIKFSHLERAISTYAMNCAEKLRKTRGCAGFIMVFIQTNRFKNNYQNFSRSLLFETPTNDSFEIVKTSKRLLKLIYNSRFQYKRAGIVVGQIIPENKIQINFFDQVDRNKRKQLMAAIDKINVTMGRKKITIGTQRQPNEKKRKQQKKSPHYTTKWEDLLQAK